MPPRVCEDSAVMRNATLVVLSAVFAAACGGSPDATPTEGPPVSVTPEQPPPPGTVTRGDASTDLDNTPISAADYAMYTAIMAGASAMLSTLTPTDKEALEFARKVDARTASVTPATAPLLARARDLQQKDLELARLQGIQERYLKVKSRIEAVIGPNAKPPAADDRIAQENLRYLSANRSNIERLQQNLRDPLSRQGER
jgi:hypothetical protein